MPWRVILRALNEYNNRMKVLVTAGNTLAMIDQVRAITNIFTGRTGATIALEAYRRGHDVTLATSHPEVIDAPPSCDRWRCVTYRSFEELQSLMAAHVPEQHAIIHSAAVSDYLVHSVSPGKIKSDAPELLLRLVRAPKLIDMIRSDWRFTGTLIKFKLEVGISEEALRKIAEKSRQQSQADWMVANTLEGASEWALVGNDRGYRKVKRANLPAAVIDLLPIAK